MNLFLSYGEIQDFVRKNYKLDVDLSESSADKLSLKVRLRILDKSVTFPFLISIEDVVNNKIRLHLNSQMQGMNDLLKGGLTVIHNNILPYVNFSDTDSVEVDLNSIPQLTAITGKFRISSLRLLQNEVAVGVSLK